MADIQFKISGDTPTFVARLYSDDNVTLCCEKFVDYSGSSASYGVRDYSVIFTELDENTTYRVKVCDRVGNLATGRTTTLSNLIPSGGGVITKNITMGGNITTGTNMSSVVNTGGFNHINISPALSLGESVMLNFNAVIQNNSPNSELLNNSITIFRKGCGEPSFSEMLNIENCSSSYSTYSSTIPYSYGDCICYTMQTIGYPYGGTISGSARISIQSAFNEVGFTPHIISPSSLVTCVNITSTTTVPPAPTSIYFEPVDICSLPYCCGVTSKIHANPPLSPTDSFKLYYTDSAELSTANGLPHTLSAMSYSKCAPSENKLNLASVVLEPNLIGNDSYSHNSYVIVNAANINCFDFFASANSHLNNMDEEHTVNAVSLITNIEAISGTYSLGTCRDISASAGLTF